VEDSKEDWMQKKERYQRRPGSRRTEDISGDSADGVNTNQFANLTFFWPKLLQSGKQHWQQM